MSAPTTSYIKELNASDKITLVAKWLVGSSGYLNIAAGTLTGSDLTNLENAVKSLFFLDVLFRAGTGGVGQGFVGAVKGGGGNAAHHNLTTRQGMKAMKNGVTYLLLNDAGLNTKGDAQITSILALYPVIAYANYVRVQARFLAAFYAGNGAETLVISSTLGAWTETFNFGAIAAKGTMDVEKTSMPSSGDNGGKIIITLTATNTEGTFTRVWQSTYDVHEAIDENVFLAGYWASEPGESAIGTPDSTVSYRMFTSQRSRKSEVTTISAATGLYLYSDDLMDYADHWCADGWYDFGEMESSKHKIYYVYNGQLRYYKLIAMVVTSSIYVSESLPVGTDTSLNFSVQVSEGASSIVMFYLKSSGSWTAQVNGGSLNATSGDATDGQRMIFSTIVYDGGTLRIYSINLKDASGTTRATVRITEYV